MAWFNPPLNKRGNKKCPNCGELVPWMRLYVWSWHQWNCRRCGSILTKDGARFLTGAFLIVFPFILVWSAVLVFWDWPVWAMMLFCVGGLVVAELGAWWLDSVVLRRPAQAETAPPLKT